MPYLSTLLLSVALPTLVFADPLLYRRAACTCPSADTAFYPLGAASGPAGDSLHCVYPPLSRCQYSTTDGSLVKDNNFGQCPTSAPGSTCPGTDATGFPLGPASGVHGNILYCTYPSDSEASDTSYFCTYSTTGELTADGDDGFCPAAAQCDGSTSVAASINSAATEGHPTSRSSVAVHTTVSFSSITPAATTGVLSEGTFGTRTTAVGAAASSGASQSQSQNGALGTVGGSRKWSMTVSGLATLAITTLLFV